MYTKKFACTMKIPKLVLQVMNLVLQLVLQVILQVKPAKKKKATTLRKLGTTACKFPQFFLRETKEKTYFDEGGIQ